MARKVFFSFHFKRDAQRVSIVRNSNVVRQQLEGTPFLDAVDWEKIERQGDQAIKNWIDGQMKGTSVTVVLVGYETSTRPWVKYEIVESWNKGNGVLGIYLNNIPDWNSRTEFKGANPFEQILIVGRPNQRLSASIRMYDWVNDNGRDNIPAWIEQSLKDRQSSINNNLMCYLA